MQQGMRRRALAAAFPHTVPILAGFLFLGMAYGIYMNVSGFSFWYPMLMGLTIFGGSLEFVAVSMLLAPFAPLQTFLVALILSRPATCSTALPCWKNTGVWASNGII